MTLSEFIKKRLNELGKNRSWLVNFGDMDWSTLSNIDRGLSIRKVTQEKLAKALQCTQGDIQACMAEQNPLRDVVVNKKSLAKMKPKSEAPAPDPEEEPAAVFQPEPEVDMMFPVEPTAQPEETAKQYRQRLLNGLVKTVASCNGENINERLGIWIAKELASYDE